MSNNRIKFYDWAIANGYSKLRVPIHIMNVFTEYLDQLNEDSEVKNEETLASEKICHCSLTAQVLQPNTGLCSNCQGLIIPK